MKDIYHYAELHMSYIYHHVDINMLHILKFEECNMLCIILYVAYHMSSDSTKYRGDFGFIYYPILISHIVLSIAIIPLVLFTYVKALAQLFDKHKKLAKITFPIWLYVAITGVVVYLMIAPYYV